MFLLKSSYQVTVLKNGSAIYKHVQSLMKLYKQLYSTGIILVFSFSNKVMLQLLFLCISRLAGRKEPDTQWNQFPLMFCKRVLTSLFILCWNSTDFGGII